ncbi:uncharacterized protein LOC128680393 isoform X2 [Plodia interpunctella]|uniref:uncharacterized protein LOC128680393 isoform X2 n=1 Tax=Plodia interpunctella TaxID=58824 RepID=UPI0023674F4E|nr:uncharacterized protein LOC128680393 isoform X2 [Plodia interpunctella]
MDCFYLCVFLGILGNVISSPTENKTEITTEKAVEVKRVNKTAVNVTEPEEIADEGWEFENKTQVDYRRILYSRTVGKGKRPYMVYLQLTKESAKAHKYRGWLCGGVVVDQWYVLTSAACVEDADHFYIVSGTSKFVDSFDYKEDHCVCKHRRRVVWKCIPKNYKFDFQDSIKWSSNDIAIVKVDKPFKLKVCEKGCEFAVDRICYNNVSRELEKPGTKGYIAGWGSGNTFREGVYRRQKEGDTTNRPANAKNLQEAKVCIMDNEQCAKKWAQRFRSIITQYMICTKDVMKRLSEVCEKKYANCTDVDDGSSRRDLDPDVNANSISLDLGRHLRDPDDYTARRSLMQGGFCENDHGGPLIVKYQGRERVVGIISACKIDPKTHSCHGPFLYTSVYRNRQFIACSIHKEIDENCRRVFRTGITHEEYSVDWEGVEEDDEPQARASEEKSILRVKTDNTTETHKEEKKEKEPNKTELVPEVPKEKEKKDKEEPKVKKEKKKVKRQGSSGKDKAEVFYESSREEDVNEPERDE